MLLFTIAWWMLPFLGRHIFLEELHLTKQRGDSIVLCVDEFQRSHGKYPDSLSSLALRDAAKKVNDAEFSYRTDPSGQSFTMSFKLGWSLWRYDQFGKQWHSD